jgi:hypothetical protein
MTTVFIDADACPVTREAISVARSHGFSVMLVGNGTQNFERHVRPGVEAISVSQGRDAADFAIVERLSPEDVVVTQDIGVAAMALGSSGTAAREGVPAVRGRSRTRTASTSSSRSSGCCETGIGRATMALDSRIVVRGPIHGSHGRGVITPHSWRGRHTALFCPAGADR